MPILESLLFGLSAALMLFVMFSVAQQLRYATIAFDMLRVYPELLILSYIGTAIWSFVSLPFPWFILVMVTMTLSFGYFLRDSIRWIQDYRLSSLRDFFEVLKSEAFNLITFEDCFAGRIDDSRPNIILRHDVDISLARTQTLAAMQKELDLPATYFFRLHAEKYTLDEAEPIIRGLADSGFRIGLHYETLSFSKGDKEKALAQLAKDLKLLRVIAEVSIVAAHGHRRYKNREIWEHVDKSALQVASAYDVKSDVYISDAGGRRLRNNEGFHLFDRLYEAKPGQIVQVLIHPDWWT